MSRSLMGLVGGIVVAVLFTAAGDGVAEEVGPFGPSLGAKALVVRTFTMKTTGAVAVEVKGDKDDEQTGLIGQCKPTMFANFGILHGTTYDHAEISIVSKDSIKTGMTGEIKLDKIWVRFSDLKTDERKFGGKGTLKLTVHDAVAGKRRMTGTITGKKLEGLDTLVGKFIDVSASFDMDFSCGIK